MKNLWYLFSAYAIIWALVGIYTLKLNGKINRLENKLEDIESE